MAKFQLVTEKASMDYGQTNHSIMIADKTSYKSSKNKSNSTTKQRRHLAWQIAPNLLSSFKFAWQGVRYAFVTQRNFRIHTAMTFVALMCGFLLQATTVEMALISLTCAMVMVLELFNTALESVVDLTVEQNYHELAKIAKDCAAGAVLISALTSLIVAGFILLPHALDLIVSI